MVIRGHLHNVIYNRLSTSAIKKNWIMTFFRVKISNMENSSPRELLVHALTTYHILTLLYTYYLRNC